MRNTLGKNTRRLLLSYIGLLTLAAFFYGGGNYIEKQTLYYNFFTNFISDLGRTTSHSGADNTISIVLFSMGMLTQIIASFYYLFNAAEYFSKDKPKISIVAKISAALDLLVCLELFLRRLMYHLYIPFIFSSQIQCLTALC